MPFLKTNSKAYRQRIRTYLLENGADWTEVEIAKFNPYDRADLIGDATVWGRSVAADSRKALYLAQKFDSEYNYADNRKRTPNLQDRVESWLSELPTHIAYDYTSIGEVARKLHHPNKLTDEEIDKVQAQWFKHCAANLCFMWRDYGINVPA